MKKSRNKTSVKSRARGEREKEGGFEINRAISQELFHQMQETEGLTNGSELTSGQNFWNTSWVHAIPLLQNFCHEAIAASYPTTILLRVKL